MTITDANTDRDFLDNWIVMSALEAATNAGNQDPVEPFTIAGARLMAISLSYKTAGKDRILRSFEC